MNPLATTELRSGTLMQSTCDLDRNVAGLISEQSSTPLDSMHCRWQMTAGKTQFNKLREA